MREPFDPRRAVSARAAAKRSGLSSPDPERDQIVLGRALRELRKRAGVTQEAVAEQLGVFPTFVGRLERGERGARWHTVRKMLRALDVDPAEFGSAIEHQESLYTG